MHLLGAISIVDNYDMEWIHNVIANIFEMVLKGDLVFPPHRIYQLRPKIFIKFNKLFYSKVFIPVIANTKTLILSPEVVCRQPFKLAESPLVSYEILCQLLALQHNSLAFIKRRPYQDNIRVSYPLIHIHSRGDPKVIKHSAS